MPRISSPRPLDLTKPFLTSSQSYGSQPFDLSRGLVTWYRDIQGDFVPDLSGRGNTARCGGIGSIPGVTGSNDTPEYNPLNYPIRSFDFSENGTTADARHIRSVGDDGLAVSSEDHTFTDGTRDAPFSVSFWLKHSDQTGTQYLAVKGAVVGTSYEWEIRADSSLRIRLYSNGSSSDYIQAFELGATSNNWDHFVITYDGSGTSNGINMYKNGVDLSPSRSLLGTYVRMQNSNLGLCVGTAFSNTSYAISSNDFIGKVHSFAIWKNRIISESEAEALYYAYLNGTGGEARSGFISRSPRLHLRELDDLPGSYSTIRRTGDPTRTGTLISNFDDETSIVFSESGKPSFPSMLPRGSSFNLQAVDIPGQESDIDVSLPIRSFQHPTYLHYSPVEHVGPFDENRTTPATDFFLSGTDPGVLPGFSSPVRSKVAIEIDLTPQSNVTLTRNVNGRNVSESQPTSPDNTGFYYYNFNTRVWEQIGLTDPATGSTIPYDFAISTVSSETSGTFPNQFSFGNSEAKTRIVLDVLDDPRVAFGYSKIGSPTLVMGAPSSTKYHATSSQTFKLKNVMSDPFMLEAIRVDFGHVTAQRTNGGSVPIPALPLPTNTFASGSIRDIDNYVFFIYRQNRENRVIDSIQDVSSSKRYLVCSASMTFWNSASLGKDTLLHGPSFSYEFGMPHNNTYAIGTFTGSISMNAIPAVVGPQYLGASSVPEIDGTGTNFIQNAWSGGTTISGSILVGNGTNMVRPFDRDAGERLPSVIDRGFSVDTRSFRKFGGEVQSQEAEQIAGYGIVSVNTPQSNPSPYLLLPEDELIFGLEAGIPALAYSSLVSNLTGSHLRIEESPCKITLFGSLVKNFEEYLPSLNQDLSSNSIHEVIGNEPVLDQFMIEPRSSYYGSYMDEIVTGSMADPVAIAGAVVAFTIPDDNNTRRVVGRRIS